MKTTTKLFAAGLLLVGTGSALADVRYVDANSTNATPPYTSWATAASGIQEAIEIAVAGDKIVVTNGTYSVGGRSTIDQGTTTNRVVVDKPLTVQSVNGPQFTIIDGGGVFRCVYSTNGASLSGFTLTNGRAHSGGGVWCESTNAIVSNCVVSGNSSYGRAYYGHVGEPCSSINRSALSAAGGAYGGTLNNCILRDNSAETLTYGGFCCDLSTHTFAGHPCEYHFPGSGGGAVNAVLNNCTLTNNSAGYGGGSYGCTLNNCTLTDNSAEYGGGAESCTLNNCTLTCNSAIDGGGARYSTLNNCTLTGNHADAIYIDDGEGNIFPIGGYGGGTFGSTQNNCIVYFNTATYEANYSFSTLNYSCTTPLPTNGVGNITNEPAFVNLAAGNYRLRADSPCIDAGTNLSGSITNDLDGRPRPLDGNGDGLAAFDMGAYEYRTPLLVWQDSPNPTPPHADWATAARTIQDAVDAALAGDEIVVTNGIYATGGRSVDGTTTNRVAVDKPLSVRSVNGTLFTTIWGGSRCVYLADSASLSGFTVTKGRAPAGGGLFCESTNAVVSNCVVSGNYAYGVKGYRGDGGGAYGGTLNNCILSDNRATGYDSFQGYSGGGAAYSTLNNCTLTGNSAQASGGGGGAHHCTLNNCTLTANRAGRGGAASGCTLNNCTLAGNGAAYRGEDGQLHGMGGGAYGCTLNNCTLTGNDAAFNGGYGGSFGGGAAYSTLNNCTLTGNSAWVSSPPPPPPNWPFEGQGPGAFDSTLNNCVVYFNTLRQVMGPSSVENYDSLCILNYSCTTPLPTNGVGNITNAPLFMDTNGWANLRLQSNSPCISAGNNAFAPAGPDLDGNPRIVGSTVDMGAYEYQSLDLLSFGIVSNQFGFTITGQPNWVIVLEASSDFTNWIPLTTNTLSGSPFQFRDPASPSLPQRFYRARVH